MTTPQEFEDDLTGTIGQHESQSEQWLRENRAALDAYTEHVEEHGVFSDGLRSF